MFGFCGTALMAGGAGSAMFVGSSGGNQAATVSYPGGTAAGDLAILITTTAKNDDWARPVAAGWTQCGFVRSFSSGGDHPAVLHYKVLTAGDINSPTSITGGYTDGGHLLLVYRGPKAAVVRRQNLTSGTGTSVAVSGFQTAAEHMGTVAVYVNRTDFNTSDNPSIVGSGFGSVRATYKGAGFRPTLAFSDCLSGYGDNSAVTFTRSYAPSTHIAGLQIELLDQQTAGSIGSAVANNMTSNSAPSPQTASMSASFTSGSAWQAFDNNNVTGISSTATNVGPVVQRQFASPIICGRVGIIPTTAGAYTYQICAFDGANYIPLVMFRQISWATGVEITFDVARAAWCRAQALELSTYYAPTSWTLAEIKAYEGAP